MPRKPGFWAYLPNNKNKHHQSITPAVLFCDLCGMVFKRDTALTPSKVFLNWWFFTNPSEKYAIVKLDHETQGIRDEHKQIIELPPSFPWPPFLGDQKVSPSFHHRIRNPNKPPRCCHPVTGICDFITCRYVAKRRRLELGKVKDGVPIKNPGDQCTPVENNVRNRKKYHKGQWPMSETWVEHDFVKDSWFNSMMFFSSPFMVSWFSASLVLISPPEKSDRLQVVF